MEKEYKLFMYLLYLLCIGKILNRMILKELIFPENIVLDNGIVIYGEKVFLRGLYELFSGALQHTI